jgi:hypothetical protein
MIIKFILLSYSVLECRVFVYLKPMPLLAKLNLLPFGVAPNSLHLFFFFFRSFCLLMLQRLKNGLCLCSYR